MKPPGIIITIALTLIAVTASLSAACCSKQNGGTAAEASAAESAPLNNEPEEAEAGPLQNADDAPVGLEAFLEKELRQEELGMEEYRLKNWEEMGHIEPDPHWVTAYTAANLRLRDAPGTIGTAIITTIPEGVWLTVIRRGPSQTVDGMKEPWFMVETETGFSGWAYSGYLRPGGEPAAAPAYDYSKLLAGDFSQFAKGRWGGNEQIMAKA